MRVLLPAAVACCLWYGPPAGVRAAEPAQTVTLGGERFPANLTGVDAAGTVLLQAPDVPRELPLADLVSWGAPVAANSGAHILLVDGSLLTADSLRLEEDMLQVDSPLFGQVGLPLEKVRGIVLHPPATPQARDALTDRLAALSGASDRLWIENGDELQGVLTALDETRVELRTAAGPLTVELDRVQAIGFNPKLSARPAAGALLAGFDDGSLLSAAALHMDQTQVALEGPGDSTWHATPERLTFLQPLAAGRSYLSDLAAASYRHVPFLSLSWPYRTDRNVLGGRLRSGGRLYAKGIGMHSASRLTYKLDRPYRLFCADAALDDRAGPRGSVVFRVFVDREERFASPIVRGGDLPLPISVDVRGGQTVSLIVDFAERGDELDHANWLDARLVE